MDTAMPHIVEVEAGIGTQLVVTWRSPQPRGNRISMIDLDGWIATGGNILAPLKRREVFRQAERGEHGSSVTWDGGEGDLSIDAVHLEAIAQEQQPFSAEEAAAWQKTLGISNSEAAGFFHISTTTWGAYKAGTANVPHAIRALCRVTLRDPLPLHAFLHAAQPPGRPRRADAAAE